MTKLPILVLDFDGVIHSYTSGWKGAEEIPDPPVDGALVAIANLMEHFDVHILSSRSRQGNGIGAMRRWLQMAFCDELHFSREDAMSMVDRIKWPTEKPAAFLTIDDRAICFNGNWAALTPDSLRKFKPWNKI